MEIMIAVTTQMRHPKCVSRSTVPRINVSAAITSSASLGGASVTRLTTAVMGQTKTTINFVGYIVTILAGISVVLKGKNRVTLRKIFYFC